MKYRFLGAVSTIYYIMAGIVLIAGCGFGGLTMTATRNGVGTGIGIILASALAALSLAAFGQLIALLVDLANNTAETAKHLAFLASRRKTN